MIDKDESSVIFERNVVPFLSDVEIRFQSSFESKEEGFYVRYSYANKS